MLWIQEGKIELVGFTRRRMLLNPKLIHTPFVM